MRTRVSQEAGSTGQRFKFDNFMALHPVKE